ncbi:peptide MFS transporter [Marinicella meishanensis]|uniref:peptide MFS transporter n=1 Tax=Marinicella meishanensis TaxID=2873263 RepID=UPI001CBBD40F|nr:peptide MFS transporter [Marinicella sp. NBU2979]
MNTEVFTQEARNEMWGHPKGLYVCFFTELWERFSFYGMKFLLVLYLTKYHLFTDAEGLDVLGAYAGMVYAIPVIGGMLADRYLGPRKAVLFGGILLVIGHLLMAVEGEQAAIVDGVVTQDLAALNVFYLALAFIILGVGFLKPNISTIVGKLYSAEDPRRDSGFTIFYMGINIGSFTATLLCGWLGETYGWGYGFGAAGIGMLFGLIFFLKGQKFLYGHADPDDPEKLKKKVLGPLNVEWTIYLVSLMSLALIWFVVQREAWVHSGQWVLLALAAGFMMFYAFMKSTPVERSRILVLIVLIASTIVFWALFEQAGASMTLFADRVMERTAFGIEFKASQFGSLNAGFIILLAPVFAWLWVWLSKRNLEPSTPAKFGLGLIQAGLGFGALVLGASMPEASGKVAMIWLVLAYLLHTTGELALSPVGLSAVTKLAPSKIVGFSMGTWFLATALSETLATRLSKFAAFDGDAEETLTMTEQVAKYTELFDFLMWLGIGAGVFMLIITPILKKGMKGIH